VVNSRKPLTGVRYGQRAVILTVSMDRLPNAYTQEAHARFSTPPPPRRSVKIDTSSATGNKAKAESKISEEKEEDTR
jgi:hypothetical protein